MASLVVKPPWTWPALAKCDEVLEKYPDSLEADDARRLIESILSTNQEIKEKRKAAGKYIGDQY